MEAQLAARVPGSRVLGLELAPVVPEPELGPAAAELEHVPVEVARRLGLAAQQELVPVVAELGLVPAAVEQGRDPAAVELELGPVEVAPRTKSVTAAHHHGLVPLLAAEDLAAAVETTREPVAIGAATAWVAAALAAVAAAGGAEAAAVAEAAVVAEAEDADDKQTID
jgi:hypothetical protein